MPIMVAAPRGQARSGTDPSPALKMPCSDTGAGLKLCLQNHADRLKGAQIYLLLRY